MIPSPPAAEPQPRRLLDQVRDKLRKLHYSPRTEEAYIGWIKRFIWFHNKRHPRDMGAQEVEAFLSNLAVQRGVSASTQNQALCGVLFLYKQVLGIELVWVDGVTRAKRPERVPVVLTREEVALVPCVAARRLGGAEPGGCAAGGRGATRSGVGTNA
jgi:integrase